MTDHGTVREWPDTWLPVGVLTCDWGGCWGIACFARYDDRFGWLPVCASCVVEGEPPVPVGGDDRPRARGSASGRTIRTFD